MRVDQSASNLNTNRNTESSASSESCNNNNNCSGHQSLIESGSHRPPPATTHTWPVRCLLDAKYEHLYSQSRPATISAPATTSHHSTMHYAATRPWPWRRLISYMQIISAGLAELHMINRHSLTLLDARSGQI